MYIKLVFLRAQYTVRENIKCLRKYSVVCLRDTCCSNYLAKMLGFWETQKVYSVTLLVKIETLFL